MDFHNPNRFGLEYIAEDGKAHQPLMVHRALYGSVERFFGVLVEHYGGAFPVWLAPVQVRVLPITDEQAGGARALCDRYRAAGIRVEVDDRNDTLNYRIRDAEQQPRLEAGEVTRGDDTALDQIDLGAAHPRSAGEPIIAPLQAQPLPDQVGERAVLGRVAQRLGVRSHARYGTLALVDRRRCRSPLHRWARAAGHLRPSKTGGPAAVRPARTAR